MTHALKSNPQNFELITNGTQTFDVRKNDRPFKIGDSLLLQEYDKTYTGKEWKGSIAHISSDSVKNGFVILGIKEAVY